MAKTLARDGEGGGARADDGVRVDWEGIEHSQEFQELVTRRRRVVIPATIFFLTCYMGFILLAGYAPDFMAESVYQGLTVGYCLALTQFVMVFVLGIWYLRKSEREFDPLADRVVEMASQSDLTETAADPSDRRFDRDDPGATAAPRPGETTP
jgi:uncharacterized membrane protein (DUF485 family)